MPSPTLGQQLAGRREWRCDCGGFNGPKEQTCYFCGEDRDEMGIGAANGGPNMAENMRQKIRETRCTGCHQFMDSDGLAGPIPSVNGILCHSCSEELSRLRREHGSRFAAKYGRAE